MIQQKLVETWFKKAYRLYDDIARTLAEAEEHKSADLVWMYRACLAKLDLALKQRCFEQ
jgi:hypothetical protein